MVMISFQGKLAFLYTDTQRGGIDGGVAREIDIESGRERGRDRWGDCERD